MTERELEIRERIAEDRTKYRDTLLTLQESHIVMNALWKLEGYEKENKELRERLDKAVELPCKVGDEEENKKLKYRAARAERALEIADGLGELCGRKEDYVQQAEKELREERNEHRTL